MNHRLQYGTPNNDQRCIIQFVDAWYVVLLLSGLLTLLLLYRYIVPLGSILCAESIGANDCGQTIWDLWHVSEAITHGQNPYHTDLLYYPLGAGLARSSLVAGFFPLTLLVKVFSGGSQFYPIYAYRVTIFFCFTLILSSSYFLLRELNFTRLASVTAAIAYAFGDFYMYHAYHLNLIAGFFIPLTALFLVRAYKKPNLRHLLLAATITAWSIYFTEFALYVYMGTAIFLLMMVLSAERMNLLEKLQAAGQKRLTLALMLFLLIITPFLVSFARDEVNKPPLSESSNYSANLACFFIPGPQHPFLTRVFGGLSSRVKRSPGAFEVFLGFTPIAFGILGLLLVRGRLLLCAGFSAVVFYVLSMGPALQILGSDTKMALPYSILMIIPPFDNGRTPVRFVSAGAFFVMIVAAAGLTWTQNALVVHRGQTASAVFMLVVFGLTIAEVYAPIPRQKSFVPSQKLKGLVAGPVFAVPLYEYDGYGALLQVFHHQPIATGYLRPSTERIERYLELQQIYERGGPEFCERIAELGFRNLLITSGATITSLDLSRCRINAVDLRIDEAHGDH